LLLGHSTQCFALVAQGAGEDQPWSDGWRCCSGVLPSMNRTNGVVDFPGIA
jgi:hypothetical protein